MTRRLLLLGGATALALLLLCGTQSVLAGVRPSEQRQAASQGPRAETATMPVEGTDHSVCGASSRVWQIEPVDYPGGQYASLALDGSGRPHVGYCARPSGYCDGLRYAYRDGSTWISETIEGGGSHASLALDPTGDAHFVHFGQYLRYVYPSGGGWAGENIDTIQGAGPYASLALEPTAPYTPHVSYYNDVEGVLRYAFRQGASWISETVDSDGPTGQYTSLALDDDGRPHISYYYAYDGDLRYATHNGSSWVTQTVDSVGDVGQYSALALDSSGRPHISYYDATNGNLAYARFNGSSWITETVDNPGDEGQVGQYTSIKLDSADHPHISYYDAYQGQLKVAYHDGTSWRIQTLDDDAVGLYTSLALDTGGHPHIAYYDQEHNGLKYAWAVPCAQPRLIDVDGPTIVISGTSEMFTATVGPPTTTLPVTVTWWLPGSAPLSGTHHVTQSSVVFFPSTLGEQTITVSVAGCDTVITTTRYVVVERPPMPDLRVVDTWPDDEDQIWYQIMNSGELTATDGYAVRLEIDGGLAGADWVYDDLGPGERANLPFNYAWSCSGTQDTVVLTADSDDTIEEEDESNNSRTETVKCDRWPPQFTWGPTTTLVTVNAAVIEWGTDEDSTSAVSYGQTAGEYTGWESDTTYVQTHVVTLTGLSPSTIYHYEIRSTDEGGMQDYSDGHFFETEALSGTSPLQPAFRVLRGSGPHYFIRANFTDTSNIERVEFYIDDELFDTDYADADAEYEGVIAPHELGMDRDVFFAWHTIAAKAFTWAGKPYVNPYQFEPQRDSIDVDLKIQSPPPDYTVYIIGGTVPQGVSVEIQVYAVQYDWRCTWGGEGPGGDHPPTCGDVATAVEEVQLLVDSSHVTTSVPSGPNDFLHTFTWDIGGNSTRVFNIVARAYDSDWARHDVQTSNVIMEGKASLEVERTVTRVGNYFQVQLHVENDASATASVTIDSIKDYVTAFQAVSKTTTNYTVAPSYAFYGSTRRQSCVEIDVFTPSGDDTVTLTPGSGFFVDYLIVPILYRDPVEYQIGGRDIAVYLEIDGVLVQRTFDRPVLPLQWWVSDAVAEADMVIVSNPIHLFTMYDPRTVNGLLSRMAHLATLKEGVLGLLAGGDLRSKLDELITPGGGWATRLHDDFSVARGGYVLIVGENEIVPAWEWAGMDREWNGGDETDVVHLTDHPYGDTSGSPAGSSGAPDLVVGRIVGNDAEALLKPLEASINVHLGTAGYSFDRSRASLLSGTGTGQGKFISSVERLDDLMTGRWSDIQKTHWRESFEHSRAPLPESYDVFDAIASGDVDGDGEADIVFADASWNLISVLNSSGVTIGSFARPGISLGFGWGDRLTVGDVTGGSAAEIIIADRNDYVYIYDMAGNELSKFDVGFGFGDDIAVGDVDLGGNEEIVFADLAGMVSVFDSDGTLLHRFVAAFDPGDQLTVGDVLTETVDDGRAEIIIAAPGADRIYLYGADGSLRTSIVYHLEGGDAVATGDVCDTNKCLAGKDDIVIGLRSGGVVKILANRADGPGIEVAYTIYQNPRFQAGDGRAVGNLLDTLADDPDEWLIASAFDDHVHIYDLEFCGRMMPAWESTVGDSDFIYFAGHGNRAGWSPCLGASGLPADFGGANPVVMASSSCLTGDYDGGDDYGMSEAYLASGAGVYIGATELSSSHGDSAAQYFVDHWDASESAGDAFVDMERAKWNKSPKGWWRFYVWEYNLYGDPKYGRIWDETVESQGEAAVQPPTSELVVEIPDYEVSTEDDLDTVEIPGGELLLEEDQYQVPYWSVSLEVTRSVKVQDVVLVSRSGLVTDTNLNLPVTQIEHVGSEMRPGGASPSSKAPSAEGAPSSEGGDSWFPDPGLQYEWTAHHNPDGGTTVLVTIFPFYYNGLSTNVRFYKNYTFTIETITSTVDIELLTTDEDAYAQGDDVLVDLWVSNSGAAKDVIVEATIRGAGDSVVDGLPLRKLHGLAGNASTSLEWDSDGFDAGYYAVQVDLRDSEGNLLDRAAREFRLGIVEGQIVSFDAAPTRFDIGDTIGVSTVFSNTGTVALTGTVVVQVRVEAGAVITIFTHTVSALGPSASVAFTDTWDTAGVDEGDYQIVGYAEYDARSTTPEVVSVSTRWRTYLPLVMRGE